MLRTTLAGLRGQARRLVLTVVAVALAVAFVAGTLILSDSLESGYREAFLNQGRVGDVRIGGEVSAATLARAARTPGVAAAALRYNWSPGARLMLLDPRGRSIQDDQAGLFLGATLAADPRLQPFALVEGDFPERADEVVLDRYTADATGYRVGDTVLLTDGTRTQRYRLAGVIDPGYGLDYAGRTVVGFPPVLAAKLLAATSDGMPMLTWIDVLADPGTSPDRLAHSLRAALGGMEITTAAEGARAAAARHAGSLRVITLGLLGFALVALGVAALVIVNTFTILVAQRTQELALLRCVGYTGGQVFGTVLTEAAVVGLAGAVLGLAGALGIAQVLHRLLTAARPEDRLPDLALTVTAGSLGAAILLGVGVTVVSALLPARRATRVAPVAALRTHPDGPVAGRAGLLPAALATAFTVPGAGLVWLGVHRESMYPAIAGCALVCLATVASAPALVTVACRLLGPLVRALGGTAGRLGVLNIRRNPRRAAATMVALTVGVTLITGFATVAESVKQTARAEVAGLYPTDFVINDGTGRPLPEWLARRLRDRPEVAAVAELRRWYVESPAVPGPVAPDRPDRITEVGSVTPGTLGGLLSPAVLDGRLADLLPGTAVVADRPASPAYRLGDTLELPIGQGRTATLRVVARYDATESQGAPQVLVAPADYQRLYGAGGPQEVLVKLRDGVGAALGGKAVRAAISGMGGTALVNGQALAREQIGARVDRLLLLVVALASLALVVALVGIANTMTLSVFERTRESAVLRALGLSRGQLRGMLLTEAVLSALVGLLVGTTLGVGGAWVAVYSTLANRVQVFAVPAGQIAAAVALATAAAAIAALLPARRATRVPVVTALADP
jgi:putative ABC transport system permease protein